MSQQEPLLSNVEHTMTPVLDDAMWLNEYIVGGSYHTSDSNVQGEVRHILDWHTTSPPAIEENLNAAQSSANWCTNVSEGIVTSTVASMPGLEGGAEPAPKHTKVKSVKRSRRHNNHSPLRLTSPSISLRHERTVPSKKRRSSFLPAQTAALQDWLKAHRECPYPTAQDRLRLAKSTSLSVDQVNRWFTNRRARHTEPHRLLLPQGQQHLEKSPLEAYLSSPMENEAVEESTIRNASQSPEYYSHCFQMGRSDSCLSAGDVSSYLDPSSSSHTPQNTFYNIRKQGRKRPIWSPPTITGSESKRNKPPPTSAPSMSVENAEAVFWCTFAGCHVRLTSKTWKRHEETKHAPRHRWTCMLQGFRVQSSLTGSAICAFCGLTEPQDTHAFACSRISECQKRKNCERTFARKDHLKQHLKNFHHSRFDKSMECWKIDADPSETHWTCGFCGELLYGWNARALHISKHFRDQNCHIKDWDVDRFNNPESQHACTTSFVDETFKYPYPASVPSGFSSKTARPDLFLHIPDMINPTSPSPVDAYPDTIITPTDPITLPPPGLQTPLREPSAFSDGMQSPSSYPQQWATTSPTPFITFTSDDPSGQNKRPLAHVSPVVIPPQGLQSRDYARLEQRVFALEAELQLVRRQQSQTPEPTFATLAVPPPTYGPRRRRHSRSTSQEEIGDELRVYKCSEPSCPSQAGFRYPLQLVRHERAAHHERRWQHIMRIAEDEVPRE
ncbi:hypothetical protein EJ05DRAFT_495952 [Pseudovirgaria hyperparasitica]|uniref:Homeobox domain-containing protein n=1 Tax=Pseudovirgaria hyperparasitica TaxID=470096 RepID=A0A6A6WLR7_9PEZI|nr:uncharacterized protein EJ05DRAFT_495952 [Pseudovirgaria hyperparasitica]KAF2763113.1 hypothetical protein EJ05DRAFT_495952 [Pseudovirgaria hyperparasitica]